MSNSYKHNPFSGITCRETEKNDKRKANRKLRRINNMLIKKGRFDELRLIRDVSDVWEFAKDGKTWHDGEWTEKVLRK